MAFNLEGMAGSSGCKGWHGHVSMHPCLVYVGGLSIDQLSKLRDFQQMFII
jgi:hypothetical protein